MLSSAIIVFTDNITDTQTDKSDHNTPSHFMWRGKKKIRKKEDKLNLLLKIHIFENFLFIHDYQLKTKLENYSPSK